MTFRTWRHWFSGVPWVLRWFLVLILIRPGLDTLYFLKEVSPIPSPLEIVGVLTPILVLFAVFSRRVRATEPQLPDYAFGAWAAITCFNTLALLTLGLSFQSIEIAVKLVLPVMIYLVARQIVRSRRDLVGVLTTFLYSTAIPFAMMLYEWVNGPVGQSATLTRGFYRSSGLYADVMSYGTYFIGAFLVAAFLFLLEESEFPLAKRALRLVVVSSLSILGLIHIHHTASFLIGFALAGLLLFHSVGRNRSKALLVVAALGIGISFFAREAVNERMTAVLTSEIAVVRGEADVQRAFHGRMSRWVRYLDGWSEEPPIAQYLGVSITSSVLSGGRLLGIHSDYLRLLFVSGYVGLGCYLLFYLLLLVRTLALSRASDRFLIRGGIAIMLLYSVTTVATIYGPLLYLCFSVFAYAALPVQHRSAAADLSTYGRRFGRNSVGVTGGHGRHIPFPR